LFEISASSLLAAAVETSNAAVIPPMFPISCRFPAKTSPV